MKKIFLKFSLIIVLATMEQNCRARSRSESQNTMSEASQMLIIISNYRNTHEGEWPNTLEDLDLKNLEDHGLTYSGPQRKWNYSRPSLHAKKDAIILRTTLPDRNEVVVYLDGKMATINGNSSESQ